MAGSRERVNLSFRLSGETFDGVAKAQNAYAHPVSIHSSSVKSQSINR